MKIKKHYVDKKVVTFVSCVTVVALILVSLYHMAMLSPHDHEAYIAEKYPTYQRIKGKDDFIVMDSSNVIYYVNTDMNWDSLVCCEEEIKLKLTIR